MQFYKAGILFEVEERERRGRRKIIDGLPSCHEG
jgi:hypothetical protein